jgi:hypothetical protein
VIKAILAHLVGNVRSVQPRLPPGRAPPEVATRRSRGGEHEAIAAKWLEFQSCGRSRRRIVRRALDCCKDENPVYTSYTLEVGLVIARPLC